MIICIAENRDNHEPALQILISSLRRYEPGIEIFVFLSDPSADFLSWISAKEGVHIRKFEDDFGSGWGVKPYILRSLLNEGHNSVLWLDSDIVINRRFSHKLSRFPAGSLVVAEEALAGRARRDPNGLRAQRWGFRVGRSLPFVANTCVLRVEARHEALLSRWIDCMAQSRYLRAQTLPFSERPPEMGGDQDALTALLCSEEFKDTNVCYLKKGRHILQYYGPYGFTFYERCLSLFGGTPPIIHSQASKPWLARHFKPGLKEYLFAVLSDVSPYTVVAKRLDAVPASKLQWTKPITRPGQIMIVIGAGSARLTGLPIAAAVDAARFLKFILTQAARPFRSIAHLRSMGQL